MMLLFVPLTCFVEEMSYLLLQQSPVHDTQAFGVNGWLTSIIWFIGKIKYIKSSSLRRKKKWCFCNKI